MTNEKITAGISALGTVMSGLVKARGYEQIIDKLPRDEWFRLKDLKGKISYEEYIPERHDAYTEKVPRHTELTHATSSKLAFVLDMLEQLGYAEHRTRIVRERVKVKTTHLPVTNGQPYRIDVYDKEGNFVGRIRNPKAKFDFWALSVTEEEESARNIEIKEYRITGC